MRCMKRTISKSKGLHCNNYNDDNSSSKKHVHIEWIALTVDVGCPIKPCVTKWISDYYQWATCMRISAISTNPALVWRREKKKTTKTVINDDDWDNLWLKIRLHREMAFVNKCKINNNIETEREWKKRTTDKLKWFMPMNKRSDKKNWFVEKLRAHCFRSMHERCEIVCEYSDN